jgi:hypothetical protein
VICLCWTTIVSTSYTTDFSSLTANLFNSFVAAFPKEVVVARLLGGRIETEHPHGAGALDLPALLPRQRGLALRAQFAPVVIR